MAVPAILAGVVGALSWLNSLPTWIKYFVFLAGLGLDSGIEFYTNFGIIGSTLSYVISNVLAVPGFQVFSWQLLILAVAMPFVMLLVKMGTE